MSFSCGKLSAPLPTRRLKARAHKAQVFEKEELNQTCTIPCASWSKPHGFGLSDGFPLFFPQAFPHDLLMGPAPAAAGQARAVLLPSRHGRREVETAHRGDERRGATRRRPELDYESRIPETSRNRPLQNMRLFLWKTPRYSTPGLASRSAHSF